MIKVPNKSGFHTGPGGNPTGIGDYMRALDKARIPMVIKSVDHYGPIFEAQEIMKKSGVPHVLIFRLSDRHGPDDSYKYDTPPYKDPKYANDPEGGAELHWAKTVAKLPPEFDKKRVWLEVVNEVDRNLCDWLGRFAVRIANLAQRDGYKVSLFGWAGGEPEPQGWETPGMLAYLRICAERPHQAAVAIHEYSFIESDIFHQFPFKIGRFQYLFAVCDKHKIPRPRVHITEWGWTLDSVPSPEKAIEDIRRVGELYARFPEIEGAAIWYLGATFGGIADKAQRLIKPVTEFTLKHRFELEAGSPALPQLPIIDGWSQYAPVENPMPEEPVPPVEAGCKPRVPYSRKYHIAPQDATLEEWLEICKLAYPGRNSVSFSNDDGGHAPGVLSNENVLHGIPMDKRAEYLAHYKQYYPNTAVTFADDGPAFKFEFWPTNHRVATQKFGVNPANYAGFGLPGHEGLDIKAPHGGAIYAVAAGVVVAVGDDEKNKANGGHNYGRRIYINHADGWQTVYAHLKKRYVEVGATVKAGQLIGEADNTGNSFGDHLHLTLKRPGYTYTNAAGNKWPFSIFDPTPSIAHFEYTVVGEGGTQPAPTPAPAPAPAPPKYSGPAVKFTPALHQPGSDWMWQMGNIQGMFSALGLPVKWLSDGVNADYYGRFNKSNFHLVRINWKPGHTYRSPLEAWGDVRDGVLRFYKQGARKFEFLNEPNLADEGMGYCWQNGDDFGRWLADFIKYAVIECPEIQVYYPGLSPGSPWTNQFAVTNQAWPHVAHLCHGVCIHAYTDTLDNVETAVADIVTQVRGAQAYKWMDRPMIVSECSVNRAQPNASNATIAAYKAAVYRGVEKQLAKIPGIEAAVWYISHWQPPAGQVEHKESWLELGLGDAYLAKK